MVSPFSEPPDLLATEESAIEAVTLLRSNVLCIKTDDRIHHLSLTSDDDDSTGSWPISNVNNSHNFDTTRGFLIFPSSSSPDLVSTHLESNKKKNKSKSNKVINDGTAQCLKGLDVKGADNSVERNTSCFLTCVGNNEGKKRETISAGNSVGWTVGRFDCCVGGGSYKDQRNNDNNNNFPPATCDDSEVPFIGRKRALSNTSTDHSSQGDSSGEEDEGAGDDDERNYVMRKKMKLRPGYEVVSFRRLPPPSRYAVALLAPVLQKGEKTNKQKNDKVDKSETGAEYRHPLLLELFDLFSLDSINSISFYFNYSSKKEMAGAEGARWEMVCFGNCLTPDLSYIYLIPFWNIKLPTLSKGLKSVIISFNNSTNQFEQQIQFPNIPIPSDNLGETSVRVSDVRFISRSTHQSLDEMGGGGVQSADKIEFIVLWDNSIYQYLKLTRGSGVWNVLNTREYSIDITSRISSTIQLPPPLTCECIPLSNSVVLESQWSDVKDCVYMSLRHLPSGVPFFVSSQTQLPPLTSPKDVINSQSESQTIKSQIFKSQFSISQKHSDINPNGVLQVSLPFKPAKILAFPIVTNDHKNEEPFRQHLYNGLTPFLPTSVVVLFLVAKQVYSVRIDGVHSLTSSSFIHSNPSHPTAARTRAQKLVSLYHQLSAKQLPTLPHTPPTHSLENEDSDVELLSNYFELTEEGGEGGGRELLIEKEKRDRFEQLLSNLLAVGLVAADERLAEVVCCCQLKALGFQLVNNTNISEAAIIYILSETIKKESLERIQTNSSVVGPNTGNSPFNLSELLILIISNAFCSRPLLVHTIRDNLTLGETTKVVQRLSEWLNILTIVPPVLISRVAPELPTIARIAEFLNVLLDAKFTSLVLSSSPSTTALIRSLLGHVAKGLADKRHMLKMIGQMYSIVTLDEKDLRASNPRPLVEPVVLVL